VAGGIDAEVSDDIRLAIWEKFVFLIGLSATTATIAGSDRPDPGEPQSGAFLLDLMREMVAVGRAHVGVDTPLNRAVADILSVHADARLDH
jgi:2-dehydropantoate 2-reductase